MGTHAGLTFQSKLLEFSNAQTDQEFIEFLYHNNSNIPDRTRAILYNEASPVPELIRSIQLMNNAEVDLVLSACMTSYYFFNIMTEVSNCPVLHPIRLVTDYINYQFPTAHKIGLLATTGTIHSRLFHGPIESSGKELITLDIHKQESVFMEAIYGENGLKSHTSSDKSIELLRSAADLLIQGGAEVLIAGCTEVSMVLSQKNVSIPFIDPMELMARSVYNKISNI
ncbi:aspartate/glutamate racemase family protein [Chryseobacterium piperi]|nr:amino acid racemase [Chryseobacterium piperi]